MVRGLVVLVPLVAAVWAWYFLWKYVSLVEDHVVGCKSIEFLVDQLIRTSLP